MADGAGGVVNESAYAFASGDVKARVHAELSSWHPVATAAHSPVLLAWAAVACLLERSGGSGAGEYVGHAEAADATDALGTLRHLTSHVGLQLDAAQMFNNIVLRLACGLVLCVWGGERLRTLDGRCRRRRFHRRSPPSLAPKCLPVQHALRRRLCLQHLAPHAHHAAAASGAGCGYHGQPV